MALLTFGERLGEPASHHVYLEVQGRCSLQPSLCISSHAFRGYQQCLETAPAVREVWRCRCVMLHCSISITAQSQHLIELAGRGWRCRVQGEQHRPDGGQEAARWVAHHRGRAADRHQAVLAATVAGVSFFRMILLRRAECTGMRTGPLHVLSDQDAADCTEHHMPYTTGYLCK